MVVTMVTTLREVDLPINADVMVVFDVLLFVEEPAEEEDADANDEGEDERGDVVCCCCDVVCAALVGVLDVGVKRM